jgi:phosphate:Na+ symporter
MTEIILSVLGGLVLFLYAVNSISETMNTIAGNKTEYWIKKFTSNIVSALFVGVVITILLDSSSAVIIITIILINSKVLNFSQGMGIVLGANIGTTISSQIIAMDIGKYSPVFLFIGFILLLIDRNERIKHVAKVVLHFGILFFGLYTMENAVEPLKNEPYFSDLMKKTDEPFTGATIGALVTLVIQSSSATVGMAILLAKKGLLSFTGSVAVMIGAELGTCSDTLLATIKGSRQAIKTGLFHVTFNLLSIMLGLLLFYPFTELVKRISVNAPVERAVANAHVLFNVFGVLIFIWTVPLFEKILNRILPDKTV